MLYADWGRKVSSVRRILDLGCGTGQLTANIAARSAIAIGIDKAPTMIEQARKNYPDLRFSVADATNFYFEELFNAVPGKNRFVKLNC